MALTAMASLRRLTLCVRHLRLPFQLILAPVFLWGALLSGGGWDAATTAAFVSLHLFLYPAATAFNSVYDRDDGPVGGLERPPAVPPGLLGFALAWAALGALAAIAAGGRFLAAYAAIAAWTAAYSHPAVRWKASPWRSGAAISLGQGALGFVAGWIATPAASAGAQTLILGAAGAAMTALGHYPATQCFQIEEDRARGDRTLAVAIGPARALRFGSLCLLIGGATIAALVARRYGAPDAVLIALGFAGLIAAQERLVRALPRLDRAALYRRAMRLVRWASAGFLLFIALEAIGSG